MKKLLLYIIPIISVIISLISRFTVLGQVLLFGMITFVIPIYFTIFSYYNIKLVKYFDKNKKTIILFIISCISLVLFNILMVDSWPEHGTGGGPTHFYGFFGLIKDNPILNIFEIISIIMLIINIITIVISHKLINNKLNIKLKNYI